jgi:acyl-coenzyme A thioesterase PaaI-like protein
MTRAGYGESLAGHAGAHRLPVSNLTVMTDLAALRELMPALVPFVKTLGLEYLEVDSDRAVLRLADDPAFHNHLGGPHAGAIFTLAESASGALVIAAFEDLLPRVTPLAAGAEITYSKVQKGPVTAAAEFGRPAAEVRAELDETGATVQFPVEVTMRNADGVQTSAMTIAWALRPHRSPAEA